VRIIGCFAACSVVVAMLLSAPGAGAQPTASDLEEEVEVRLVMIETVALDAEGNTVADMTRDEFRLTVDGLVAEIDTFDVLCDAEPGEAASIVPRGIVLLLDYYHLAMRDRGRTLETAQEIIRTGLGPNEQVMVAAMAGGLRIEQRFTDDPAEVVDTLERMKYDSSLFARDLSAATGSEYFEDLATLMDVLAQYDGPKAVVLFSPVLSRGDVKGVQFDDIAERAASARAAFYPAFARWMQTPSPRHGLQQRPGGAGGSRILTELAVDSGGRVPPSTNDLYVALDHARLDLTCQYGIGYRMSKGEALSSHELRVVSLREDVMLNHPNRIRFRSDEEERKALLRAAFADPERFEHPLVRAIVSPIQPLSRKSCETLFALHFPSPAGTSGITVDLAGTLAREGKVRVVEFEQSVKIPEPKSGDSVPVTVFGLNPLDTGEYTFTVTLSSPDLDELAATRVLFEVPPAPKTAAFIRGPVLARVVTEGVRIRTDQEEQPGLDDILDENESFEPLVVHEISAADTLLATWTACSGTKRVPEGAVVARRVTTEDGATVHELEPVAFEPAGANVPCQVKLDRLAGDTLEPGEYLLEIAVADRDTGERSAVRSVPLLVD
jgi:VWFA-related protein